MARYKYQGHVRDGNGNVIPSALIEVFLSGTSTPASIYTASVGGSPVNQIVANSVDASYEMWVDDGEYDMSQKFRIKFSKSGYSDKTYDEVNIFGGGGGSSGSSASRLVTQTSHGFNVGDILYYTGTEYAKAQADTTTKAEVVGIVSAVSNLNSFTILAVGYISGLSGLVAGSTYFLSDAVAGAYTLTEPSDLGDVSKPVFTAISTTEAYFFNMRGAQIMQNGGMIDQDFTVYDEKTSIDEDDYLVINDNEDSGDPKYIKVSNFGAGGGATKIIAMSSHGFSVGDVLKYASGTYSKAQADSIANAEVVGIVSAVKSLNEFTLLNIGYISGLSGLTAGTVYFLSESSAGALTSTEPSTAGQVSKPLLVAISTTEAYFFNFRGSVVQAASTLTTTTLVANNIDLNLTGHADGDSWYESSGLFTRLAKGPANTKKFMNAAGTAPEWASGIYIGTITRDMTAGSGDVSYTGIGFKGSALIASGTLDGGAIAGIFGVDNGTTRWNHYRYTDGLFYRITNASIMSGVSAGNVQTAYVKSWDADGFTLTWTKTGSPTGTGIFGIQVLR